MLPVLNTEYAKTGFYFLDFIIFIFSYELYTLMLHLKYPKIPTNMKKKSFHKIKHKQKMIFLRQYLKKP